jgi:hypothetical protein
MRAFKLSIVASRALHAARQPKVRYRGRSRHARPLLLDLGDDRLVALLEPRLERRQRLSLVMQGVLEAVGRLERRGGAVLVGSEAGELRSQRRPELDVGCGHDQGHIPGGRAGGGASVRYLGREGHAASEEASSAVT